MTPPAGYALVWSDDFPGAALDATKWVASTSGNGGGLGTFTAAQATVANGLLNVAVDFVGGNYKTVLLNCQYHFRHCYFEALAKFPSGNCSGLWMDPLWMWADDYTNTPNNEYRMEVDVSEAHKASPNNSYNYIYRTLPTKLDDPQAVGPDPFLDGLWHKYAALWTPSSITYYYDDAQIGVTKANIFGHVPNRALQLMVLGTIGGYGGTPDGSTTFPAVMQIDYVKVYQQQRAPVATWS